MATHPSILAWTIPWKRSLAGARPQSGEELDTAESLGTKRRGPIINGSDV